MFLFLSLFLISTGALGQTGDQTVRVDEIMAPWHRTDSPGCAVAVIKDGRIVHAKGYGMANLEHGIPITPETTFYAGSVSKQFVATSILLLQGQGRLSVDDPVQKYLPEIPDYGHPITLRHLIHHTSGLRDYLELTLLTGRDYLDGITEREVLQLIARQRGLNFEPGSRYSYSNTGYFLLAEIVKRVSGQTLRAFAEEEIFEPLGMADSHFHDDNTMIVPHLASGYFHRGDGAWGLLPMRFALVGSGGLYTTVEDLYRWDQNFYQNRLGDASPALIEALLTRGILNSGDTLAYAFALNIGAYRGLRTVSHSGSLGGYRAHLQRFPDQHFSTAFLCNAADINPGRLANRMAEVYLGEMMAAPAEQPSPAPAAADGDDEESPAIDPADYASHYYSEELDATYSLDREANGLSLSVGGMGPCSLHFVSVSEARYVDGALRFVLNRQGRAIGFTLDALGISGLAFEREGDSR